MKLVWLPGLDGQSGPHWAPVLPHLTDDERASSVFLALPDEPLGYAALVDRIAPTLPPGPLVLVGESFAGPLSVRLAERVGAAGVVLGASFVARPLPAPACLVGEWMFRAPPPRWALRAVMAGGATDAELELVRGILTAPSPEAMAARLRAVLQEDASAVLSGLRCPVGYLQARRDHLVPPSALTAVRRARPDVVVAEVDGPHLLFQITPAAAVAGLRDVLGRMFSA